MTEQRQYRVIADRDKGDVPTWNDVEVGDLVVSRTTPHPQHGGAMVNGVDMLIRIERPVPTTAEPGEQFTPSTAQVRSHYVFDQSNRWDAERGAAFDRWLTSVSSPHLPTREQINSAVGSVLFNASNYPRSAMPHILGADIGPLRNKVTEAVLAALIQNDPDAPRVAGADLARTDENGHWIDIWLDTEGPS